MTTTEEYWMTHFTVVVPSDIRRTVTVPRSLPRGTGQAQLTSGCAACAHF